MLGRWFQDLESLEAISQDVETRRVFLRLSRMSQTGRTERFLSELRACEELDEWTKAMLTKLAEDSLFLLAVEDYVRRTQRVH